MKADRTKYIRRVIGAPILICSELINVVNSHIQMDWLTLEAFQSSGGDLKSILKSHMTYRLITLGAKKAIYNVCIHICNGCICDSAEMAIVIGEGDY